MERSDYIHERVSTRLRVMIADDVPETLRNTRIMLGMNPDVDVIAEARNGREALELAITTKPDLVIMDINMPHMDGLSAYEDIYKVNPDIACICISAEKDNQILRRAMSVGAREYLIKPFTVDELNIAVSKVGQVILRRRRDKIKNKYIQEERETYLQQLAQEYAKDRRSDDQALEIFERLAENPECELRWLRILAMIYVIRKKWKKLENLANRLDHRVELK